MSERPTLEDFEPLVLDEQQVADYLRDHPDFFVHHQRLLETLQVPHQQQGAVSLVERQTQLLRTRNRELQQELTGLLEAAHHNDQLFVKTKRLVLELIGAGSLTELAELLNAGLCQDFDGDLTRLILFKEDATGRQGSLCYTTQGQAEAAISELLSGRWAVCGQFGETQRRFLFQEEASQVLSAAVIPLLHDGALGVLAIGSREAHHFHSSMGTLFVDYLGEVVSRVLVSLRAAAER